MCITHSTILLLERGGLNRLFTDTPAQSHMYLIRPSFVASFFKYASLAPCPMVVEHVTDKTLTPLKTNKNKTMSDTAENGRPIEHLKRDLYIFLFFPLLIPLSLCPSLVSPLPPYSLSPSPLCILMYKIMNGLAPNYLQQLF